jgi:protein-disulfide isomerase
MTDTSELTRKERRAAARASREEQERAADERARRQRRLWQLGGTLAIAVAIVAILIVASQGGKSHKATASDAQKQSAEISALIGGIPQHGMTLGNPKAPLTWVEFADLQCPFCREYTAGPDSVLSILIPRYVRTGQMKMEFRNLAFIGADSTTAAQMAAAAGLQNKLWNFVETFYANQQTENTGYVTDPFLKKIATQSGLDVPKALKDRNGQNIQNELAAANSLASANGITGTPSFLYGKTGGTLQKLSYSSFDASQFTGPIDAALRSAQK